MTDRETSTGVCHRNQSVDGICIEQNLNSGGIIPNNGIDLPTICIVSPD